MSVRTGLVVLAVAVAIGVVVYWASGGRLIFFVLPLLFGLPFLGRGRR